MKTLTTLVLSALLTVGCSMTGQVQAEDDYFSQGELDSMLAPVALYPDSVLSHVLIAATYPLEVIQAARWSREHPGLRGEDAVAAVDHQNWDPSVKALVAFPELLERMDEDLDWTQRLGDAFLVQEEDVIASIQYLRSEAYSHGKLKSNDRVKVVREKEYIYIEPARTRVVYVPYYDPRVVYSSWRWSSHPPVYWHRPSGFSVSMNFHWGRPYHVRPNFYFSSFHWAQRRVVVVNHHHHYYRDHGFRSGRDVARFKQARHWKHDPTHRRGVSYRGQVEQTRFVDSKRPVSARQNASVSRSAVRSDRREWAAERRSSTTFDRKAQSRTSATSRSDRAAETRGSDRGNSNSRTASRSSARTESSRSSERSRSVTGQASERAATRSSSTASTRSSADRSSRVSESLRSGSTSRAAETSRSRGAERSSEGARTSNSRASGRASAGSTSRSDSKRSSVSVPRDLSVRSSNTRERSSSPSRSSRSSAPSRGASIGRNSAPSKESAPSRSRSGSRESAPSRSTPSTRSSAPSRSSESSAPSRGSRSSAPSRSSKSSAPSRSRDASTRSSRGSAQSRSRGGDSRRGGRGDGEERR